MSNDISLRDREIRLLYLLHNEYGAEDIGYSLLSTSIDRAPPYEALSYAWGKDIRQVKLRGGAVVTMRTNLYHALRYLQRPYASRLLWIDALCINQDNDEERSHQAQLMTQIYATAWRVLVWLGEANDDLSSCLTLLNQCRQAVTAVDESHSASPPPVCLTQGEKESVKQLIDRPYFKRTWVLQETMVAKVALVMWSHFTMPFENLITACHILDLAESRWSDFNAACHEIITFGYLRRVFQGLEADRSSLGMTPLLMRTIWNRATDPRDKIFALFGIANQEQGYEKTPARPDYRRTVEDVYIDVARFLVGDDHSLQILSAIQHIGADSALPSWVPDWGVKYPIRLLDAAQGYLDFRVHGGRRTYPVVTHIPDRRKLALAGFSFDMVCTVVTTELTFDVVHDGDRKLFHSFRDRRAIANAAGHHDLYPPTREDVEVAWLRTVSAGLFPSGTQLDTSFAKTRYPQHVRWSSADETSSAPPPREVVEEIFSWVSLWTKGRRVFVTQKGFLGLGPAEVEPGDVVCILFGGNLPYVVRHLSSQDEYTFLGPSYVHGIMDGEAYDGMEQIPHETFVLV
jgi:hypothetical protein